MEKDNILNKCWIVLQSLKSVTSGWIKKECRSFTLASIAESTSVLFLLMDISSHVEIRYAEISAQSILYGGQLYLGTSLLLESIVQITVDVGSNDFE